MKNNNNQDTLLTIHNLKVHFSTENGIVKAVDGINLSIQKGEIVGLVGESGSGKSITALSIMGLLPKNTIIDGEILFNKENLLTKNKKEIRKIRGNNISIVFQDPMSSLNPCLSIGEQISEGIRLHQGLNGQNVKKKTIELLKLVDIPSPETRIDEYPHQLSGGMRQRIMIAMAISCNPLLLIADEPTTSFDVTIQAQIIELMKNLIKSKDCSLLLITHDFGIVAEMCDRVAVMKDGKIVEENTVKNIFDNPKHPYTKKLLDCLLY